MRHAAVAGFVLIALPAVAVAQGAPYLATVTDDVRLRAGPSDKFPETGPVARGVKVVVDHEESNGWLAIEAPSGSVSWVQTQFIESPDPLPKPPYLVNVATDGEVSLSAGQAGVAQPLDIRKVKIPNGTILTVIGPSVKVTGDRGTTTWYPVEPPPGDFRYLPRSAVQPGGAVSTAFSVRDTPPPGLPPPATGGSGAATLPPTTEGSAPPAGTAAPAAKPVVNYPLWAQADEAEKAGRYEEAEKLLFQLAQTLSGPNGDHDVVNLCFTRIHTLREKTRPGTGPTAASTSAPGGTARDRATLLPPVRDDRTVVATPTSKGSSESSSLPPAASSPAIPPQVGSGQPGWSGAGVLKRTVVVLDGRQTYALESVSGGVTRLYVVGTTGVDLSQYVNRQVDLYGTTLTRKDLKTPYIVVTKAVEANP